MPDSGWKKIRSLQDAHLILEGLLRSAAGTFSTGDQCDIVPTPGDFPCQGEGAHIAATYILPVVCEVEDLQG